MLSIKKILFNRKLKRLNKITFERQGFNSVGEKFVVDLSNNKVMFSDWTTDEVYESERIFNKEYFLTELSKLNLGDWKKCYSLNKRGVRVLDGEYWSINLEFENGKKKSFGGYSEYPYNFQELIELL